MFGKNAFNCFSSDCKAKGNVLDFVAAMEHCTVKDAALKLADWFKVGESEPSSKESEQMTPDVPRGSTQTPIGTLFEVIATALSGEDFKPLVVYRELSRATTPLPLAPKLRSGGLSLYLVKTL